MIFTFRRAAFGAPNPRQSSPDRECFDHAQGVVGTKPMQQGDNMNLDVVFKQEIRRLARKEFAPVEKELRAAVRQHKKEITNLKRLVASLGKARKVSKTSTAMPDPSTDDKQRRFSPKRLAQLRAKKDLTLAELATLTQTSTPTLYKWLSGDSRPSGEQLSRIAWIRAQTKKVLRETLAASA